MARVAAHEQDFSNRPLGYTRNPGEGRFQKFALSAPELQTLTRPKTKFYDPGVRYDQGNEGACVGFANAAYASWFNYRRSYVAHHPTLEKYHFPGDWIYHTAQEKYDPWAGTDYEGTSTDAGMEVLRVDGARAVEKSDDLVKIQEYRWATNLDDILNWICFKSPVLFGTNWYSNFDNPKKHTFPGHTTNYYFIGEGSLGSVRGGHCIIATGYKRDDTGKEWIRLQNSWGYAYPLVFIPAAVVGSLLQKGELEAGVITHLPYS